MRLYNLRSYFQRKEFERDCKKLADEKKMVRMGPEEYRTLSQNALFHVWCLVWALHSGNSVNYVKQVIFKEILNDDIFMVKKYNVHNGDEYEEKRSTADLSKEEFSLAMDRMDKAAIEMGFPLPTKEDKDFIMDIKVESSKPENKKWLGKF